MCGIFGVIAHEDSGFTPGTFKTCIDDLFLYSESRGKEAAGLAIVNNDLIQVYKQPLAASKMIRSDAYNHFFRRAVLEVIGSEKPESREGKIALQQQCFVVIGHSRLVTSGAQVYHGNNQPVIADGIVGVHNGIIVNDDALWKSYRSLQRRYQVDTEVILSLLRNFYRQTGSVVEGIRATYQQIEGTASIAVMFADVNAILLATNNGSLYLCSNKSGTVHIFASERYVLRLLTQKKYLLKVIGECRITPIKPGVGLVVCLQMLGITDFPLTKGKTVETHVTSSPVFRKIVDAVPSGRRHYDLSEAGGNLRAGLDRKQIEFYVPSEFNRHMKQVGLAVEKLRRCCKCLLPETMPFIKYDKHGICNFCHRHKKLYLKGLGPLMDSVAPYRKPSGEPDCIVTFSGGRDSSYGLHFVKRELDLNPIAYTYDWGMVNDLARRNQARMCGKLGVEHILVSADIRSKRKNISKCVTAWLKRPHLGTVPLFMAGDKQYFYFANRLKRQTGVNLVILCDNLLETTSFKYGFCGIPPAFSTENTYSLSLVRKTKMAFFYGKEYLLNQAYLNAAIFDTVFAFFSYYLIRHQYLNIYSYIPWAEEEISRTLIDEYDWEAASDTSTTWRIGDGTAGFYNYIYYVIAGFTENDTFRSNQIRGGMISREDALRRVEEENLPRYKSIQWYCDTIGIDFENTIRKINNIPKLYPLRDS
jgi:asparagine synthetase B (glutamine-hydrolysing)